MSISNYLADFIADLWDAFVSMRYFIAVLAVCVGACLAIGCGIQAFTGALS